MKFFKFVLMFTVLFTLSFAKVDINTADKSQLMTLKGVGASKADAIIEYRKHDKFSAISDLKKVKGFGEKVFDKIKNDIEVTGGEIKKAVKEKEEEVKEYNQAREAKKEAKKEAKEALEEKKAEESKVIEGDKKMEEE